MVAAKGTFKRSAQPGRNCSRPLICHTSGPSHFLKHLVGVKKVVTRCHGAHGHHVGDLCCRLFKTYTPPKAFSQTARPLATHKLSILYFLPLKYYNTSISGCEKYLDGLEKETMLPRYFRCWIRLDASSITDISLLSFTARQPTKGIFVGVKSSLATQNWRPKAN